MPQFKLLLIWSTLLVLPGCQTTGIPKTDPGGKAVSYSRSAEIPQSARPNDATISLYETRRKEFIRWRNAQGRMYSIKPKGNSVPFKQEPAATSVTLDRELSEGYLLSYLYYEDGVIKYNGKARDGRFASNVNNQTLFFTHSTGKSIVSYIVGHAICDGYITSMDEIIDWPMMRKTLYQGQPLRNLLNMSAGDRHTVDKATTRVMGSGIHHRDIGFDAVAELLAGTKSGPKEVFYNNVLTDVIANYVAFKAGEKYDDLMRKVFQDKIKIEHEVLFEQHESTFIGWDPSPFYGQPQTRASYSFFMTRMDFLRTAEAMMKDYQNQTCVGQYLKEAQSQARDWYREAGDRYNITTWKYGAQFYFGFDGMRDRNIFLTVGGNGQNMMIDMDNSRIVVTNSAARGWDKLTFILEVIKSGKLPE